MNRILRTLTGLFSSGLLLHANSVWQPAVAQIAGSAAGCPPGTRENTTNLVRNSIFATNAGTGLGTAIAPQPVTNFPLVDFGSDLPYRGDAVYPSDPIGGISIQDERFNGGVILGAPGVVSGRGVTAAEAALVGVGATAIPTYLYSNPNLDVNGIPTTIPPQPGGFPAPVIWQQSIAVAPNTVYNFKALFFNLLLPGNGGENPRIRLRVGPSNVQTPIFLEVGDGSPIPGFPGIANVRQAWVPVQFSFTTSPGQTTALLQIVGETQRVDGDDFGMTAVGLRECLPNIGVAKAAGTPVANADGSFTIPYTVRVRNSAPPSGVPDPYLLSNIQLTEDLSTTFANATILSITDLQSPTLVVNPGFNGTTDQNLLQPGVNTLGASVEATVSFNVTIRPGTGPNGQGPFENTVTATGTSDSGVVVRDRSTDGTNTDPDGDGNPGNNDNPTLVPLPPGGGGPLTRANVVLVKRITNVTRDGAILPGVNFGGFVNDPTTTTDNDPGWAQLNPPGAPVGMPSLSNTNPLRSGDEVEYTIYFLSNGTEAATDTSICDLIPPGTTLIFNTNQVRLGNSTPTTAGTVFSPLAPLPPNNSCLDQRNPNGAVIFELGTLTNTPTDNVGFARFRVRIN